MSRFWDRIFGLNYERSLWVDEDELGKERIIFCRNKRYSVKIPKEINGKITLRLRGIGKKRLHKTGDLMLQLWLNKGEDVRTSLWLPDTSAKYGANMKMFTGEKAVVIIIPANSYHGLTIRLKGLGRGPRFDHRAPPLTRKKRGNLFVKLHVYPDCIMPEYGAFDTLSTENMALEGWVYRKYDEVMEKLGKASFPDFPIPANIIAELFNNGGLVNIFNALVDHLRLGHLQVVYVTSSDISAPGSCTRSAIVHEDKLVGYRYLITIKDQFLNNPFAIAAILAHELCHVVYSEKIDISSRSIGNRIQSEEATLEEERTVDLLVFMFKIGEFQLRVSRDTRLTLGYFNQQIFDRMQVIVSKKINAPY